jgi:hypothetical protein
VDMSRLPVATYSPHPLVPGQDRVVIYDAIYEGETITDYLERSGLAQRIGRRPVRVTINGHRVPRAIWRTCRPRRGTQIYVQAVVEDSGGDSSKVIRSIAMIALIAFAPQLAPAALGAFGTAAVVVLGSLAINTIFPPPKADLSAAQGLNNGESPTYSITGGSNRARPYEPFPVIMGLHRVFPDLGAKPFTEFRDNDQFLNQVFNFGFNDITLSSWRIGNTPIESFTGVVLQESDSTGELTTFPTNIDSQEGGALTAAIGFVTRTSSANATALAVEIAGTQFQILPNGAIFLHASVIEIDYRAVGTTPWLPLSFVSDVFPRFVAPEGADDTTQGIVGLQNIWIQQQEDAAPVGPGQLRLVHGERQPLRRVLKWDVPQGQYEVRVARITADETDPKKVSELVWTQLRTYQAGIADHTGMKRVALQIRANGQLSGVVDSLSALAQASTEVWNGSAWVVAPTSNPAWWALKAARGKFVAGRRVWGAGLPDTRIDLEGFKAFGAWCDAQQLSFNGVFDQPKTAFDMINTVMLRGRATPSWASGKLTPVWDASGLPVVAVFQMSNIEAGSFEIEYATEDLADEIVANFINPELDYARDQVRALAPGVTTPTLSRSIELFGCAVKREAAEDANLYIANNLYRYRKYRWRMDFEGMPISRGEVGALAHDLASVDASGRLVEGTTASVLKLERKVTLDPAGTFVTVVKPDGTMVTAAVQAGTVDTDTITLTTALSFNPSADASNPVYDYKFLYSLNALPGRRVKVELIRPLSDSSVEITAFDEVPEYYTAKSGTFVYSTPPAVGGIQVSNLRLSAEGLRAGNSYAVRVTATWDTSADYLFADVTLGLNDHAPQILARDIRARTISFVVADLDKVTLEVTGYTFLGRLPGTAKISVEQVIDFASISPPADVQVFTIEGNKVSWVPVEDVDVVGYSIRFQTGNRRSWGDAVLAHNGLVTETPFELPVLPPPGRITLMIKAVDSAGIESVNPAFIVTDFGDPVVANVVEQFDRKAAGWPGTLTGGSIVSTVLQAGTTALMWDANDETNMWHPDGATPMWSTTIYSEMAYTDRVAISAALAGSLMTLLTDIDADDYTIEYRENSPKPMWSSVTTNLMWSADSSAPMWDTPDYQPWPGQITSRNSMYDFRITTRQSTTQGIVNTFTIVVDAPDVDEKLNNIAISAIGTRLPITKHYTSIKVVNLTLQADGGTALKPQVEDKDPVLGPLVKCYNSSNVAVTGTVDALIQGY